MKNYGLWIAYDGTRYDGWQRQGNTENTIQGKLEEVLGRMTGFPVEVQGAGRTDAGVHAKGQRASVHLETEKSPEEIKDYLNHYLPEDIAVLQVEPVPDRFHARLHAEKKLYCYRIGTKKEVFERKYRYPFYEKLDVEAMRSAAGLLCGTHDFKSFCANKKMKKSTVRTIYTIQVTELEDELQMEFCGNGFLYHMVRILAGTLIEVGLHKRTPESMCEILEAKNRQAAGETAPARGLTLEWVAYDST
ncbi:MAG: tRNA pseudouridine(38-40) synthase TruA [Lachnospiraceae bacterium]|jgi:tRNA pseudouridine38-40 synthase